MPFGELLKKNILIPVGMTGTSFDDMVSIQSGRASGYNIDHRGIINCSFEDTYKSKGCGGIISTAEDLFRWSVAVQSGKIVSESSSDLIFLKKGPFGYGWILSEQKSKDANQKQTFAFHAGSDFGFASYIFKNLTTGKCIIILGNIESAPV
jgi:CubicO group peptidase (beta-lactamase class C family)